MQPQQPSRRPVRTRAVLGVRRRVLRVKRYHFVDQKPKDRCDTSRVLCIRAGDCKAGSWIPRSERRDAWTLDPSKVTCPRCLEWLHS